MTLSGRRMGCVALVMMGALLAGGCNSEGPGSSRQLFDWTRQSDDHPDTGERWAILLYVSRVSNHYRDIRQAKEDTADQTDWDDELMVVHEATHSKLLRGRYNSSTAASKDLEECRTFTFSEGGQPFSGAVVVKLPQTDYKEMFPQWDLSKAVGKYTVCVAVFYNYTNAKETFSRRRWAAEMYCKHLRENLNREAYYHHGKSRSSVTIGSFPARSVLKRQIQGREVTEIVDPRIDRVRQIHPELIVNGWTEIITVPNAETRQPERKVVQSYLVKIPDKEGELDGNDRAGHRQPRQAPRNPAGTGRPERISPWP